MGEKKYNLNDLKMCALDFIKFTDRDVLLTFLNLEVGSKVKILEALGILKEYRPKLLKELEKTMRRRRMIKKKRQNRKNCKCKDNKNCDCRKNKPAE